MAGDEWRNPGEIKFSRDDIMFIIFNFAQKSVTGEWELVFDKWPKNSGKLTEFIKSKYRSPFEAVVCLLAEVNLRLKQTKTDGQLLMSEITAGITGLHPDSRMALNFISGWRRRKSYSQFKADRRRHR